MRGFPGCIQVSIRLLLWSALPVPSDLSPLELHGRFRDLVNQGKPTRDLALQWSRPTGDGSFDAFLEDSPGIRQAMELEQRAISSWDQGKPSQAIDIYRRAARLRVREKAFSEAAFCYYFIGELLVEEERVELGSQHLRMALAVAGPRFRPFLTGLIFQGLAANFWLRGDLDLSIRAFGDAQACWERIQFSQGQIANLHNLALLYQELGFPSKAGEYYERALGRLKTPPAVPEISFQVLASFTRFLVSSGDRERARETLELARRQRDADRFELLMLEHKVTPDQETAEALAGAAAPSTRGAIRRNLQLAEETPAGPATRELLVEALKLAEQVESRFLRHKAEIVFGKWLERRGENELAMDLYSRALADAEIPTGDLLFPFSRIADPALEGLVRVLIGRGRWQEARKVIRGHLRRRLEKTLRPLSGMEDPPESSDEVSLLVEAAAQPAAWGRPLRVASSGARSEPLGPDTLAIELWPDGDKVYVWLWGRALVEKHLVLQLGESVSSLVHRVVDPLYTTGQSLPPPPPPSALRRLSRELVAPLEPHLQRPRLLLIAHKELQLLPFEMLSDREGRLLLDEFFISYLPPASTSRPAAAGPPLAVLPALAGGGEMMHRERWLFSVLFGDRNTALRIQDLEDRESDWIHVSSHLTFDPDLWYKSTLSGGGSQIDLWQFLHTRFRSRLLSLSACDAGNSHNWPTPFWMGIAGLLLERNSSSLVLNRWKLDEASVEIYLGFARRVWQGASLDVALTEARREFRKKVKKRGPVRLELQHPFFWAGVSYIGRPGVVLYPRRKPIGWIPLLLPLVIPGFTLIRCLVFGARFGPTDGRHCRAFLHNDSKVVPTNEQDVAVTDAEAASCVADLLTRAADLGISCVPSP